MTRRQAIKTTALAGISLATLPRVYAQTTDWELKGLSSGSLPFKLPPLPYATDSLEPYLDARTLELHHNLHHAGYVRGLNLAIASDDEAYRRMKYDNVAEDWSVKTWRWLELWLGNLENVPLGLRAPVQSQGGGHYNHSLFWRMMKKNGGGEPRNGLGAAIQRQFGSFADFKDQFTKAALGQFGSGWAWLTLNAGLLKVESTPNQDTPLSQGRQVLLGLDLWEHAYYLKYQNKRSDYINAWWNVVNWDFVAERYANLKS